MVSSSLSALAQRPEELVVLRAVERVVGIAISDGRASFDFEPGREEDAIPATLAIEPARRTAAALAISFDVPSQLYVTVGRYETSFEILERSEEAATTAAREFIEAVISGRYEEEVKVRSDGTLVAARGTFLAIDGKRSRVAYRALGAY
jgi:hypothetical protein